MKLPDVILLNGASSSGKSPLSKALLARLPFVSTGIDEFVWERVPFSWYMAVERYLGGPRDAGLAIEHEDEPAKLFRAFHRSVRACVAEGLGVVVDDCIVRRDLLDDWMTVLDGLDVFFVGVHCAEEELLFRERARRDRPLGGAAGSMNRVHAHAIYDLEVESTAKPSSALAGEIIAALEARKRPNAFERLQEGEST